MMKTFSLLLAILAFLCTTNMITKPSSKWTTEMYQQYDFNSFAKSELAQQTIDPNNVDYPLLNAAIFYASNKQRRLNGKALFKHSEALESAAFGHSEDMVKRNFFSHTSKVAGKKSMSNRLALVGIQNTATAENIAESFLLELEAGRSYYTPSTNGGYFSYEYKGTPIPMHTYFSFGEAVVDQWMHSPGHKANLMNATYNYLGCGAYVSINGGGDTVPKIKSTQNFSGKDAQ